jgi:peptidoglycan/LPS O-acetylase OafA/YrhL
MANASAPLVSRSARNPQLDGLRAFAIALVIVAHALRLPPGTLNSAREALGEVGVSVFFVLSGFLITTLLIAEREKTGTLDLGAFFVRRARRIFPAYYVYLGVLAILAAIEAIAVQPREFIIDALYLRDYSAQSFSWLEHTWSLAVETQFYLFWPALMLGLGNARARNVAIGVIVLSPFIRIGSYALFPAHRDLMTIALHTRADMLMFGCATALSITRGVPVWFERVCRAISPVLALVILAACIAATGVLHGLFAFSIGMTIEGIAITTVLVNVLERPAAPFAVLLRSRPATWIGTISYSLYLWQQPFLFPRDASLLGRFPINLFALLTVACASYYLVERTFFQAKPVRVAIDSPQEAPS